MKPSFLPWARGGLVLSLLLQGACGSDSEPVDTGGDGTSGDGTSNGGDGTGDGGDGTPAGDGSSEDGSDGSAADGTDGGFVRHDIAAADLCTELTTLLCEAEQECCSDLARRHESVEACLQAEIGSCVNDIQPAAQAAKTGYSPSIAGEKFEALYAKLSSCDLTLGDWFVTKAGLLGMFEGTVPAGGDCTPSDTTDRASVLSCESGSVCRLTPNLLTQSADGTCGAERASGEQCVTELECSDGLRCNPPESLAGSCQARLADGSVCSVNGDCASLLCIGSRCEARTASSVYCFN